MASMVSPLGAIPGTQPAPAPDIATLMGGSQGGMMQAQPAAGNEQAQNVMVQIRDLSAGVDALARQYPAAAGEARETSQALTRMMVKIVESLRGPEPAGPQVLG